MPIKDIHQYELERMVKRILSEISPDRRWPRNVTEEVFVAIENSFKDRMIYKRMIGDNGENKDIINPEIGRMVKDMTGLETIREQVPATKTNLISYYTELG